MENATKALMIAGAVLIAILIIGVGMMIYNSAQGSIEGATSKISQQEIGTTGDNVPEKVIQVTGGGKTNAISSTDLTSIRASIIAGKRYNISFENNDSGFVHTITIKDVSAGEK